MFPLFSFTNEFLYDLDQAVSSTNIEQYLDLPYRAPLQRFQEISDKKEYLYYHSNAVQTSFSGQKLKVERREKSQYEIPLMII